ncbi:MAG: hypothetical protein KKH98_06590 [Spirochaetes bacterium]|nr:hypothetical protein [Spirochaetota bacterium]
MAAITFAIAYDNIRNEVLLWINENREESGAAPVTHEQLARKLYLDKMKDEYMAMMLDTEHARVETVLESVV